MRKEVFRPEPPTTEQKVRENQEEIKKLKDTLKKTKDIVIANFALITDLTESMSKLVKMLNDPNYGTNYLNDEEKK